MRRWFITRLSPPPRVYMLRGLIDLVASRLEYEPFVGGARGGERGNGGYAADNNSLFNEEIRKSFSSVGPS